MLNKECCLLEGWSVAHPTVWLGLVVRMCLQFIMECHVWRQVGDISWMIMEMIGRVIWCVEEVNCSRLCQGGHYHQNYLQDSMHTVRVHCWEMAVIFAGMYSGTVLDPCVEFHHWYFLCGSWKPYAEAFAVIHALAGWKGFLDHCAAFPVSAPVLLTAVAAANTMVNGIAILCQVSEEGKVNDN